MRRVFAVVFLAALYLALPRAVFAQVVWEEKFEGNLNNWQITKPASCTVETQQVADRISPDGGKHLFLYQSLDGQPDCSISRNISPPLTNGKVSLWFFDNVSPDNLLEVLVAAKDSTVLGAGSSVWLGVRSSVYTNTYAFFIDGEEIDSGIPRSFGWRKFEFIVSEGEMYAAIDGMVLRHKGFSRLQNSIAQVLLSARWNRRGATRIDGVKVEISPSPIKETTTLTPQNGIGMEQTFETKIKSVTGVNYFDNIFFYLTDTAPDEANSDVSPMFILKKDTQGVLRFYGNRWLGTLPIIGNPNIGMKNSYAYDVGGFMGGSAQTICTTIGRVAQTTQTGDSFSCLDVSRSSAAWDSTNSELVVRWHVRFLPNFVSLRSIRRDLAQPSLGFRELSLYLAVDNPLAYMLRRQDFYTRYNWQKIGSYQAGAVASHSRMDSIPSPVANTILKTTITHPTDATQINEVYLWLDEEQPNTLRSDVALSFVLKKSGNQYSFFGRRYTNSGQSCANQPFYLYEEECSLNYTHDVGGIAAQTSGVIYANLDRIATLYRRSRSLGFLHTSRSRAYINPQNNRELIVEWDLRFLPYVGPRNLDVSLRWVGANGTSGNWQKTGQLQTAFTILERGAIRVTSNGQGFQFSDGTPYSMIGVNQYFLQRVWSEREIEAYFAKMQLYGMNYVRIFIYSRNPMIDMLKYVGDSAKRHGVYINFVIFNDWTDDFIRTGVDAPAYGQSKTWARYILNEINDIENVFMLDMLNDFPPVAIPVTVDWMGSLLPYVRSLDNGQHLLTYQTSSDGQLDDPSVQDFNAQTDAYSIRGYAGSPTGVVNALNLQHAEVLTISPVKPVYVGEAAWRNDSIFLTQDWKQLYQSSIENSAAALLSRAKELGLPGVHLWQGIYRAENLQGNQTGIFPQLTPRMWQSYLSLSTVSLPEDVTGDDLVDPADIKGLMGSFALSALDLTSDQKANSVDYAKLLQMVAPQ